MMMDPLRLASRAVELQPFRTLGLLSRGRELAASGRDVIRLDVGEPDFGTPEPVADAARSALGRGTGRYTEGAGRPALRNAIAASYDMKYGVAIDPRRVIVTTGSSAGLMIVMAALLEEGYELLTATPGYPAHPVFARVVNGRMTAVAAKNTNAVWGSSAEFERAWGEKTRGILVGSPSNPTGSVIPWSDAKSLIDLTKRKSGIYISEELYHGLSYDVLDHTALEHSDDALIINSFSKYYAMTGWRLGWIVVPDSVADRMEMLAQHLYLSAPDISQAAALGCFTPAVAEICDARRLELKKRRDTLLRGLLECGFEVNFSPDARLYIFADARRFTGDSFVFARRLLEAVGVSVAPGIDFGDFPTHLRFSFCTGRDRLEIAIERIRRFLEHGTV